MITEIKEVLKQEKPETIKEIKREIKEELATKEDTLEIRESIKELEVKIEESKAETIKWIAGLLIAQSAFILALLKILS